MECLELGRESGKDPSPGGANRWSSMSPKTPTAALRIPGSLSTPRSSKTTHHHTSHDSTRKRPAVSEVSPSAHRLISQPLRTGTNYFAREMPPLDMTPFSHWWGAFVLGQRCRLDAGACALPVQRTVQQTNALAPSTSWPGCTTPNIMVWCGITVNCAK